VVAKFEEMWQEWKRLQATPELWGTSDGLEYCAWFALLGDRESPLTKQYLAYCAKRGGEESY
jgi:hypothetical protein